MNINNLNVVLHFCSSDRTEVSVYDAEGMHYNPFILKDTEVGSDAEGTHLTLVKEGGYDIQATPMEAVSKSM